MKGKVIKYNERNINTDLIIPARYLIDSDPNHLSKHCMEDLDPDFNQKLEKNHFTILVADSNFGCGSSREQAAGIKCIIATSYARIFFRNALNIGLPIIEFDNINAINTGDDIDINFENGTLKNLTDNTEFKINKMPTFLQHIISVGGLVNFARNRILKNR